MAQTTDPTDLADFRDRMPEHFASVEASGRPLFVTDGGATRAVVLSPSAFDDLVRRAELGASLAMLDRGMDDARAGRTRPAKAAVHEIADELGLTLGR